MLVYISVEKFISIGYPFRRRLLTRTRNQIVYLSCLFSYCSAYSIVIPFCYDLISREALSNQTLATNEINSHNSSYMNCEFVIYEAQETASYLDLVNRQFVPMILMICFSCLLVTVIFKSRSRIANSLRNCFVMNFIFFACNTPTSAT